MSFVNMIQPVSASVRLRHNAARMNRRIADRINDVRKDPAFICAARTFTDHEARAPALTVLRELSRIPVSDPPMRIGPNDGSDLQHAVVALAYCDFALLDRKWVDFAERARRSLVRLGIRNRFARSFSKRQVPRFLQALEAHPNLGFVRA